MIPKQERLGAHYLGHGSTAFRVWSPNATTVEVHGYLAKGDRLEPLTHEGRGYFSGVIPGIGPGDSYRFRLDGREEFADPASRWQPTGIFGPSAVIDPDQFVWHDALWSGRRWEDLVFYEIHVGSFSDSGQFSGVIADLPRLARLGITAIEIMPIAAFPGKRNWGYDGVFPYAPQASYGGPEGFQRLVDASHMHHIAVFLDVVYNHTGPEGSVLAQFGPYFNTHYHTPWGQAINFDGPQSDAVREFFAQNAEQWIVDYHVDGLRLDAVHAIIDTSAEPFLRELTEAIDALSGDYGRPIYTVAESDRNDPREIVPRDQEGLGFSGQWNDDLHHALHTIVTDEHAGYYQDYGSLQALADALAEGYVYTGQYSSYRQRRHGRPFIPHAVGHLVVYGQNHDQVGNRPQGDRLSAHLSDDQLRLVAATVLLSPTIPLLFMGEEYKESAPFPYFIDHTDPRLVQTVREGRTREWAYLSETVPDPADPQTFFSAKLSPHREHGLFHWYQILLAVRREYLCPHLMTNIHSTSTVHASQRMIQLTHEMSSGTFQVWLNFSSEPAPYSRDKSVMVLISSATPDRVGTPKSPLPVPLEVPPLGCLVTYHV